MGRGTRTDMPAGSEYLVSGDTYDVSAEPAIRVHAARAISPFGGEQPARHHRCFEGAAESRVRANAGALLAAYDSKVGKPVDAYAPRRRPGRSAADSGAGAVTNTDRGVPAQRIVE